METSVENINKEQIESDQLYLQMQNLLTTQVELARTELSEKVTQAKSGAYSVGVGGVIGFFAMQTFVLAAILILNFWFQLWFATLIVSVVLALASAGFLYAGKRELKPQKLKPQRTMRSLQENFELAKRGLSGLRTT